MTHHIVKSWPKYFEPMLKGIKKHDMRNMKDRSYSVGDTMTLQEFDPFEGKYTGRTADFRITYKTNRETPCALSSAMLDDNAVILSVEKI